MDLILFSIDTVYNQGRRQGVCLGRAKCLSTAAPGISLKCCASPEKVAGVAGHIFFRLIENQNIIIMGYLLSNPNNRILSCLLFNLFNITFVIMFYCILFLHFWLPNAFISFMYFHKSALKRMYKALYKCSVLLLGVLSSWTWLTAELTRKKHKKSTLIGGAPPPPPPAWRRAWV